MNIPLNVPPLKISVTGASGFVGNNLVRALLSRGHTVKVLLREGTLPPSLSGLPVEPVLGDVLDPSSLDRCFSGADLVFHLAALISIVGDQGGKVHRTNVEGARNAALSARKAGVRRFVHVASVHAFNLSFSSDPVTESTPRATGAHHAAYDRSKALGEAAVRAVEGLDAVILHPSGIVGPGDYAPSRMGQCLWDLLRGRLPALTPGGFDWVDVRDVVEGVLSAAEKGRTGESYILSGAWHSIRELAVMAEAVSGVRAPRFESPMWLARTGAPFMTLYNSLTGMEPLYTSEALDTLATNCRFDASKSKIELGYSSRPIAESVRDFSTWQAERVRR